MTNRELIVTNIKKLVGIAKHNGSETLVTLNKEFIPGIYHDKIDKIITEEPNRINEDYEYFDILNQKIASSNCKKTDWGFLKIDLIKCKNSIDMYYLNDTSLINNYNKTIIRDFIGKFMEFKTLCEVEKIEIQNEDYFREIVIKNNYNQNLLLLSALFNVHPQNILDNNVSDNLDNCKKIWKEQINIKKQNSIDTLLEEKENIDEETILEEISIILNMLNDLDKDIDKDFEDIKDIKDLIYYWPSLLLPAPRMVNYE
jgi:hypothetical protein